MREISLMTANQEFSKLIREVERGQGYLITRRGQPVARLIPHAADKSADPVWAAAYRGMMARLEQGASLGGLRVEREDIYDR